MLAIGDVLKAEGQPTLEVAAIDNGSYICRDVEFGPNLIFRADELAARYGATDTEIVETSELEHWERFRRVWEKYGASGAPQPDDDAEDDEDENAEPDVPTRLPTPNEAFGDSIEAAPQEAIIQESRQFL